MSEELVSQARELRQQLLEQEERLRLALQAANLGTWEHVPGHACAALGRACQSHLWAGRRGQLGLRGLRCGRSTPADLEGVYAGIGKAMDPEGSGRCTLEYRITTRDGRERWVEAHGRCVFAEGVPQRINGTLLDITERKQAEETVRETVRRKDEFLAVLGHELRNPLAPIRTALDLMAASYPEYAVREREVIDRQLRHVTRLVDDLLDLARVTSGSLNLKREASDLMLAVKRAIEIASPLFDAKRHRLLLNVPPGISVLIDPRALFPDRRQPTHQCGKVHSRGWTHHGECTRTRLASSARSRGQWHWHRSGPARANLRAVRAGTASPIDPRTEGSAWVSRWSGIWCGCMAAKSRRSAQG
ncbi:MAG: histidine kinase dimerization/phospho-acceptor domain-containing protein [Pseudomonadota bacterium]